MSKENLFILYDTYLLESEIAVLRHIAMGLPAIEGENGRPAPPTIYDVIRGLIEDFVNENTQGKRAASLKQPVFTSGDTYNLIDVYIPLSVERAVENIALGLPMIKGKDKKLEHWSGHDVVRALVGECVRKYKEANAFPAETGLRTSGARPSVFAGPN